MKICLFVAMLAVVAGCLPSAGNCAATMPASELALPAGAPSGAGPCAQQLIAALQAAGGCRPSIAECRSSLLSPSVPSPSVPSPSANAPIAARQSRDADGIKKAARIFVAAVRSVSDLPAGPQALKWRKRPFQRNPGLLLLLIGGILLTISLPIFIIGFGAEFATLPMQLLFGMVLVGALVLIIALFVITHRNRPRFLP